jgi:hypothetical protein
MHELGLKNGHSFIDCETKLRESMIFKRKYHRGHLLNAQLKGE